MLIQGDCIDAMRDLIAQGVQVDSIVTDPPYELGFMGKAWDKSGIAYNRLLWKLCFDLLKPGGHLISFGGSRTYHRMACAIEDAGFEVRDQLMWLYGQGFPKSLDISKAMDKAAGADREVVSDNPNHRAVSGVNYEGVYAGGNTGNKHITAPATEEAKQWQGWGSALKPAHEPIVLARKPLSEKTIAENVLKHGTGAINVDGCRVELQDNENTSRPVLQTQSWKNTSSVGVGSVTDDWKKGRFPANLIHDGSDEVEEEFANQSQGKRCSKPSGSHVRHNTNKKTTEIYGKYNPYVTAGHDDIGGNASRFFYCAKASKKDRNGSKHPTVKPISLMRYLCRLITPPGGIVLDPFAGSGTTGQAALEEGFKSILIEKEQDYITDIKSRLGI